MACGWFIKNVIVTGKTVSFYIGANSSWSIVLKGASGVVEANTSGYTYGTHNLIATSYGTHTLELNCNWKSSGNPCEVCSFNISDISLPTYVSPVINDKDKDKTDWMTIILIGVGVVIITTLLGGKK